MSVTCSTVACSPCSVAASASLIHMPPAASPLGAGRKRCGKRARSTTRCGRTACCKGVAASARCNCHVSVEAVIRADVCDGVPCVFVSVFPACLAPGSSFGRRTTGTQGPFRAWLRRRLGHILEYAPVEGEFYLLVKRLHWMARDVPHVLASSDAKPLEVMTIDTT